MIYTCDMAEGYLKKKKGQDIWYVPVQTSCFTRKCLVNFMGHLTSSLSGDVIFLYSYFIPIASLTK